MTNSVCPTNFQGVAVADVFLVLLVYFQVIVQFTVDSEKRIQDLKHRTSSYCSLVRLFILAVSLIYFQLFNLY